ncbi:ATP-binding protein [Agrobacterium rhizogenes]|uniref:slr1658 superfamily regulator n=1 Tax=Rhizobium rhizogenes TaxID=359 RepID=UPI001573A965|nr:ATP-binding protein [Rhizobium rhizogenes]NTI64032.1 ATP-binding protein [Rhizobium rhizogenes]
MTTVLYGREHLVSFDTSHALRLRLLDGPLHLAWKHSAITSDFIAEMIALSCRLSIQRYKVVRHDIGYLTNELIENAIKFRTQGDIVIEALVETDSFRMRVSNFVDEETAVRFQRFLSGVTTGDPGELLIQQIEASVAASGNTSGLGLLTLMSDYQAHLAWRFEDDGLHKRTKLETYAAMAIALS